MSFEFANYAPGARVHIPNLLIHGKSPIKYGIIQVVHHENKFPPQSFEVNSNIFKLLVHLEPGLNDLVITHYSGSFVNGYPKFDEQQQFQPIQIEFPIYYEKIADVPEVQMCLLVAKDSPQVFDSMDYKIRFEGNDINAAVRKLRMAARLMEAFTAEQMLRNGFGNRAFRFAEEMAADTISSQENGRVVRPTVKIHIIPMEQTVAQIRDPDNAQQNPSAKHSGILFDWARDAINKYKQNIGEKYPTFVHPMAQKACIIMDTHWEPRINLLLGHAALGGIPQAICGSHGLWSWPNCFEDLYSCFSDCTITDTSSVVNDLNEGGTAWEALTVSMGAFFHEIGHLLGCPHALEGVMRRDYTVLNRSFMTKEFACARTKKLEHEPVYPQDECIWDRRDIIRFAYLENFKLPIDNEDKSLINDVRTKPDLYAAPDIVGTSEGFSINSETGVYLIELRAEDIGWNHFEFLPKLANGGSGPVRDTFIKFDDINKMIPDRFRNKPMEMWVLAYGGKQTDIKNIITAKSTVTGDFGYGKQLLAFRSTEYGGDANKSPIIAINPNNLVSIRVFYGMALDGIEFIHKTDPATIHSRRFFKHSSSNSNIIVKRNTLFGNRTNTYTDIPFTTNEFLTQINVRSGAWVDAVQIITNNKITQWFGNANGGSVHRLMPPAGYQFVGITGQIGDWINSIQAMYSNP